MTIDLNEHMKLHRTLLELYEKSKNIEQERQEIINTLKDMKLTGMKLMNLGEPNNCIVIKDNKCYMFNYDKGDLEEINLSIYILRLMDELAIHI